MYKFTESPVLQYSLQYNETQKCTHIIVTEIKWFNNIASQNKSQKICWFQRFFPRWMAYIWNIELITFDCKKNAFFSKNFGLSLRIKKDTL